MMELSGMLPSTDNLFKFLFIGGLLMVFTAMIYPMQKRQLLEVEIVSYNKEVELINNEIDEISSNVKKLKALDNTIEKDLKHLQTLRDNAKNNTIKSKHAKEFTTLKNQYMFGYTAAEKKLSELKVKKIILDFNKNKITLLQNHSDEYGCYTFWFLIFGIPLALIGISGWAYSTYITVFKSNP